MKHTFKVTGMGLTIDKVMIMPGNKLTLNAPAPRHWDRFGERGTEMPKEAVVATPEAKTDGTDADKKTKKRLGLETQAEKLDVEFTDETSDDDLIAAIKAKKDQAKS